MTLWRCLLKQRLPESGLGEEMGDSGERCTVEAPQDEESRDCCAAGELLLSQGFWQNKSVTGPCHQNKSQLREMLSKGACFTSWLPYCVPLIKITWQTSDTPCGIYCIQRTHVKYCQLLILDTETTDGWAVRLQEERAVLWDLCWFQWTSSRRKRESRTEITRLG